MKAAPNNKQSYYLPTDMLIAVKLQATRLDRSQSWIIQKAWELASGKIATIPAQSGDDSDLDPLAAYHGAEAK